MTNKKFLLTVFSMMALSSPALADGQSAPINYDSLSFVEKPLAVEVGPATVNTNILLDQSVQYNARSNEDAYNTRINGDVAVQTQLPNSWRVKANYVGSYNRLADDEYTDNIAVSIADEWGTVSYTHLTLPTTSRV